MSMEVVLTNEKIEQVLNYPGFMKLCQSNTLPVKTKYWLGRLQAKLVRLYEAYAKEKTALIDKHASFEEGGEKKKRRIEEADEGWGAFKKEFDELVAIPVPVAGANKIEVALDSLTAEQEKNFSAADIAILEDVFDFKFEEKKEK